MAEAATTTEAVVAVASRAKVETALLLIKMGAILVKAPVVGAAAPPRTVAMAT
jgi:hypothetical protein